MKKLTVLSCATALVFAFGVVAVADDEDVDEKKSMAFSASCLAGYAIPTSSAGQAPASGRNLTLGTLQNEENPRQPLGS